jgi:hypothetical protein
MVRCRNARSLSAQLGDYRFASAAASARMAATIDTGTGFMGMRSGGKAEHGTRAADPAVHQAHARHARAAGNRA